LKSNEVAYYGDVDFLSPECGEFLALREAAAGWIASPTDVLKVLTAIDGLSARPDVFNATTRSLMFQKSKARYSTFGLGWDKIVVDGYSLGYVLEASKNGLLVGTNSWAVMDFRTNVSYAVVTNKRIMPGWQGAIKLKELIDSLVANVSDWPKHDLFEQVARTSGTTTTTSETSTSRRQISTNATSTRTSSATATSIVMPETLPTSTMATVPAPSSTNAMPTPGLSAALANCMHRTFVVFCFLFCVAFPVLFF